MTAISILSISLPPIFLIAVYIYFRDKYEKEPIVQLLKSLFTGIVITLPILAAEYLSGSFSENFSGFSKSAYNAFIGASLPEEGFKYVGFLVLFWRNKNFNEKFDGIVYSVYISLGFAAVENILYVYSGGFSIGVVRALTAVPAHALFGIVMGFYLGLARFNAQYRGRYLFLAIAMPFIWHGAYDTLLLSHNQLLLMLFVPFIVFFWIYGFRKMKELSDSSEFRTVKIVQLPDSGKNESISI
jgi:RsiW-degrading membrane proteinase PrsW (M82 family)